MPILQYKCPQCGKKFEELVAKFDDPVPCPACGTRAERDWTQADLADRVGISRQAVISIEKYKYTPSLELAFKIAEAFGVSIDQVFAHKEDNHD